MITLFALAILAIAAIVASVIVTMRDGYRAVPTRTWSMARDDASDSVISRLN